MAGSFRVAGGCMHCYTIARTARVQLVVVACCRSLRPIPPLPWVLPSERRMSRSRVTRPGSKRQRVMPWQQKQQQRRRPAQWRLREKEQQQRQRQPQQQRQRQQQRLLAASG